MKRNNEQELVTVLSAGFEPDAQAKARVRAALQRKLQARSPLYLRWALSVGGLLVLIGIGLHLYQTPQITLYGPSAMYISNRYVEQRFGESGPRGLEDQVNYIRFQ